MTIKAQNETSKLGHVDLLSGEIPLQAWHADNKWGASGVLYLTTERIVWIRQGFNLIPGRKEILIDLSDIKKTTSRDLFWTHLVYLRLHHLPREVFRMQWGFRGKDVADAINGQLKDRGLLT